MDYFAGLDVSIEETAVCVVDGDGSVIIRSSVPTAPEAIALALKPYARDLRRVGHEAGALSPWLQPQLKAQGVPAICLETRHMRATLAAQRNKTDAADALGIAHVMRTGWYRIAHVKTEGCYRLRLLLTQRRNLKRKLLDIENGIRHSLKAFGIRLGKIARKNFEPTVREAVADDRLTAELMDAMLGARAALWREYLRLHDLVVRYVAQDALCRRFMAIPGVGPVTALTFITAIDDPSRFQRSRDVAAYFGLTSRRWQSGTTIDIRGRISKAGDADVRRALYEAATSMLTRFKGEDRLKNWGTELVKSKGHKKAAVAVARKMSVVMHAIWRDGTAYNSHPDLASDAVVARAGEKVQTMEAEARYLACDWPARSRRNACDDARESDSDMRRDDLDARHQPMATRSIGVDERGGMHGAPHPNVLHEARLRSRLPVGYYRQVERRR